MKRIEAIRDRWCAFVLRRAQEIRFFYREAVHSFATASTFSARVTLASSATIWAVSLPFSGEAWETLSITSAMRATAPLWVWCIAWGVLSAALWWRLIEAKPRVAIGKAINTMHAIMWALVAAMEVIAAGTPAVIGQTAGMFILALWVAIRTSVTPRDKWAA